MAAKSPTTKSSEESFESAMMRLEKIVEQMESDQLPLEELLTRYEEGVTLVKACEQKLAAVEKRIDIITRNAAGEPQIEEFEPEKKPAAKPRDDVSLF
jgi:exodeoxyribonuclease VII small subunit